MSKKLKLEKHILATFMELFDADPHKWVAQLMAVVCTAVAMKAVKRRLDWHDATVLARIYEELFAGNGFAVTMEATKTQRHYRLRGIYPPTLAEVDKWLSCDIVAKGSPVIVKDQDNVLLAAALTVLAAKGRK